MEVKLEVGQAADPRGAAGSESPDKEQTPSLEWSGIGGVKGSGKAEFWAKRILRYQVRTNFWTWSPLSRGDGSPGGVSGGGNSNKLMELWNIQGWEKLVLLKFPVPHPFLKSPAGFAGSPVPLSQSKPSEEQGDSPGIEKSQNVPSPVPPPSAPSNAPGAALPTVANGSQS